MPWDVRKSTTPRCSFHFSKELAEEYQELLPIGTRKVIMNAMLSLLLDKVRDYGYEQIATAFREDRVRLEVD